MTEKFVLHHTKQKKGKETYIYHSLAWYYRINSKPHRDVLKHLGKLTNEEVDYYRRAVDCMNREPNTVPCHINDMSITESKKYLSCAVGLHFWDYWKLSSVFDNYSAEKDIQTSDVAKILTVIRLAGACSKNFSTKLFEDTSLPALTNISPEKYNKARIFRELSNIEDFRENLAKHIFETAKKEKLTNGNLLFYDLSSGNLSGLRCVIGKWGHCKDGYRTHVVLLLVITPEGYPVYWDVLEGNTADSTTIEQLIAKVNLLYGEIDSWICFDRGMVSDDNLKILEDKNISYITALDGNQISHFDEMIDFNLFDSVKKIDFNTGTKEIARLFQEKEFSSEDNNLYYKELLLSEKQQRKIEEKTLKLNFSKRRYFLAFNPEMAALAQKHRKENVADFVDWVKNYNSELSCALGHINKETVKKNIEKQLKKMLIHDVDITYSLEPLTVINKNPAGKTKEANTYRIALKEITEQCYDKAKKYDGIWMLITNTPSETDKDFLQKSNFNSYFTVYRLKNTIEEAFRILSDVVEVEPFHVYIEKHLKAHFTLCVLTYLIDITILNKIRASSAVDNMSLHSIFYNLGKCDQHFIRIDKKTTISKITEPTKKQTSILQALGCAHLVKSKYLSKHGINSK